MNRLLRRLTLLLWPVACGLSPVTAQADEPRRGRAVIVIGLPGDAPHRQAFAGIVKAWHKWLSTSGGFAADEVVVIGEDCGNEDVKKLIRHAAQKELLEKTFREIGQTLTADDRFWLLMLGHGNHDGRRAWFHLPGPDLDDQQWAAMLRGVRCRQQVVWSTFSGSGWFLKPLSAKGRVVIAATQPDDEFNATEFPAALADIVQRPLDELDANSDGRVSVLELFRKTGESITARFGADERLPTEHALLDDSGDGRGTEVSDLALEKTSKDGALAESVTALRRIDG